MSYKLSDLNHIASRITASTVALHDYHMVTPKVSRVIISHSPEAATNRSSFRQEISALFKGLAAPIEGSFRKLTTAGNIHTSIGYVRANSEVREFDEKKDNGRFKQMSGNLLMDKNDQSLWEVRNGSTGRYLVSQGDENLSELVALATVYSTQVPRLSQVASAPVLLREFACYVDLSTKEISHGYVVANTDEGLTVLPVDEEDPINVTDDQLVEVVNLDGEDEVAAGMKMSPEVASDVGAMKSYYTRLYSYAPDYLAQVMKIIDQHAVA